MCASFGTIFNFILTFLSCDNTGSITDGTVTYPIVSNLLPTDVKVPRCVAGRISNPRLSAMYPCRNEPRPGTTGVKQCSHENGVTVRISGARHSDWVLLTLVGIGTNCEHFGSVWCCTVLSVWGGQNYFFYFQFLCLIWHVNERCGWELPTVQRWASNSQYWWSFGTLNF